MKYALSMSSTGAAKPSGVLSAFRKLWPFMKNDRNTLILAFIAIVVNAGLTLLSPLLIGYTIDAYVTTGQYGGVLLFSLILLGTYIVAFVANYYQTILMGSVGQRLLFSLRNAVFTKLQELPVAFFNQNKAGDLISRINNDTDKLNQFFSQALMQFIGNAFMIIGAGIFLLVINPTLGSAALAPAVVLLILTQVLGAWIRRKNLASLQALGGMSAEIQESLNNFKVVVAFNRRDYFRVRFDDANEKNFSASVRAGIANNIFTPIYGLASNLALLIVLTFGIYLLSHGLFAIGLLISFLSYVTRFYDPLRQLASVWASFQAAMAGWDRISAILSLESDLTVVKSESAESSAALLTFRDVHFAYPDGQEVLHGINLELQPGKTYALVGPTGGGKTTTASLMARLYDPTEGTVLLDGKDIRSYEHSERTRKIGFILQEPFLFTGTVRDNILYGNERYQDLSDEALADELKKDTLDTLLERFENGLQTKVTSGGDAISLGQKQLIAFIRAVLRHPDLLILDEATANIDTVTEKLLDEILHKLPASTTRVIIAHRLNTIANADEIYFVNAGDVIRAGSFEHALDMLLHGKRAS
ncbi:MAG TPA: ABC transporter ATP-binding protein [Candidatus Peribacteraceae bacterium]|nr:ABC transporter ATP-binding protein [Candidatus Peribacteraceae bacterium]